VTTVEHKKEEPIDSSKLKAEFIRVNENRMPTFIERRVTPGKVTKKRRFVVGYLPVTWFHVV
jgi:hypothetical protein